jgi:hypothetical protein
MLLGRVWAQSELQRGLGRGGGEGGLCCEGDGQGWEQSRKLRCGLSECGAGLQGCYSLYKISDMLGLMPASCCSLVVCPWLQGGGTGGELRCLCWLIRSTKLPLVASRQQVGGRMYGDICCSMAGAILCCTCAGDEQQMLSC